VPHRDLGGLPAPVRGLDANAMLASSLRGYVLLGTEPVADSLASGAAASLQGAGFVVALTPYASEELKSVATVLLPIGSFAETSGTYVNLEGRWQSFAGVALPVGEARPAWKVLRVLGNLLGLSGFEQDSSGQVLAEVQDKAPALAGSGWQDVAPRLAVLSADASVTDVAAYQIDAVLRRSPALQASKGGLEATVHYGKEA
jgi:NADH-quinone oxidoreductase subunit G